MLHRDDIGMQHHENRVTVTRETEQRKPIIETINLDMINHFPYTDIKSLVNIATCLKASEGIANYILQLTDIDKEEVNTYGERCNLNALNL